MKILRVKCKFSISGNLERSEYRELYKIKEQRATGSTVRMLCPRIPWTQIRGHVAYFWIRDSFKGGLKGASWWWREMQAVFAHLLPGAKGHPASCQLPWHPQQEADHAAMSSPISNKVLVNWGAMWRRRLCRLLQGKEDSRFRNR